ncbi:MAG: hypothetical protein LBT11_06860 [Treponema sp.]|jgi:hypothetical protein|nr:hypothetical protein [Treponema sp.]
MAVIKSALEVALERTGSVKSDKTGIGQYEAKQRGKRLANEYLAGGKPLEEGLKVCPREELAAFRQGCFDMLIAQLGLPALKEDAPRIETLGRGLQTLIADQRFTGLVKQFNQIIAQYLAEIDQYDEAIKQQYAPKLRQKEEELARRLGRQVKLDPFQDPEFTAFYNQNIDALKANYQAIVDQVREQAQSLFRG